MALIFFDASLVLHGALHMYTLNYEHKNSDLCIDYVFWKKFLALQTTLHILCMPCSHINEKHCF